MQAEQNELSHSAQIAVHSLQAYRPHRLQEDAQSLQTSSSQRSQVRESSRDWDEPQSLHVCPSHWLSVT